MTDVNDSLFPGDTDLAAQALNAVRAGADPDQVRKLFLEEAAKRGADPSKITTDFINDSSAAAPAAPAVDKATKKQYQDVISGAEPWDLNVAANRTERQDDGLKGLIAPTIQKNSPVGGNFSNVAADSDTTAPRGAEKLGYALAGTAGRGLAGLMGLAAPLLGDAASADEQFEAAKKVKEWSDKKLAESIDRTSNGVAKGGDMVAGSLLGGLLPTTMLGEQFNAGTDALDEGKSLLRAEGESLKTGVMNEAMLGAGMLGSQAKGFLPYLTRAGAQVGTNVGLTVADKKIEGEDVTTGDVALAAGMGLGGALFRNEKAPERTLPKTGDAAFDAGVEHATSLAGGDIDFGKDEPIPAPKKTNEAKQRERDEIKTRADALGVSVKEYKEATGYSEEKPSAPSPSEEDIKASNQARLDALNRKAEGTPDFQTTDEDGNLVVEKGEQGQYLTDAEKAERVSLKRKLEEPNQPSLKDLLSQAEQRRGIFDVDNTAPSPSRSFVNAFYNTEAIPQHIHEAIAKGTLTANQLFDHVITNPGGVYHPEIVEYAKEMRALEKKFGGGDATYTHYNDDDAPHTAYMAQKALQGKRPPQAWYSGSENRVRVDPNAQTMHGLLHEGTHAILSRAIETGRQGKLAGEAQLAYKRLENLFNEINPKARETAGKGPLGQFHHTYGLSNIHEFITEVFTNPAFRQHLRSISADSLADAATAGGRHRTRAGIGVIRNAYDAVVGSVAKMLGLSPKATTALDMVVSGAKDFFGKTDPTQTKGIFSKNDLGAAPKEEKLQKPRNSIIAGIKEAFASGGIDKRVSAAEQAKQGLIAEGDAEAVQSANRLASVVNKGNKDLVSRSLAGDVEAFKQLDPKTREVVRDEYKRNFDRSLAIVKEIDANPNATPEMKAIASKILENAGKYQMDVYTAKVVPRSMKDKYALAQKAQKKLAANKKLNDQEREALNHVDEAKKFLEQYYLPDTEKLKTFKTPHLEDLYHYYTGKHADEALGSFETKALRKEALMGEIAKGMRDTVNRSGEVENLLKNVMGIGDKASSLHTYYNNMRAGSDIYSVHTKVPEALKQLWEPVLDPVARNVASIRQQYNYIANLHSQNMLAKDGMGTIFTKERGHATHNARIEGSKMGALQGLYTTPDVKRALDSIFTLHSMTGDALDSLVASRTGTEFMLNRIKWLADKAVAPAASFTKLMSVVGNAGNYANNFVGSAAQIMANGNINPVAMAKGMRDAAQMIGIGLKKNMSESVRDLFKYRIAEYSHIAELKGSEHTNMVQSILKRSAEAANPLQALQKELSQLVNGGRHAAAVVKELYGAMDFWTKAANWHNELGFWKDHFAKIGQKMTDDELKQFVAQRVNATNITPSAAGKLFRGLERYGITRFGTYYAEVARTLKNNIGMGASDMADGIRLMGTNKAEGAKLFLHGAKRFAGASGAILAHNQHFAWMAKGIASAAGLVATQMGDDDPVKKYMQKDDFLGSMDPLLLTDPQHPEDGTFVYDLSHADPFGPITMPIKTALGALIKATDGKDVKGAQDMMDQFKSQASGLYLSNALWGQVAKQMKGSGTRLEKENPEMYNKISEWLTTAGFEVKGANRAINAVESTLPRTVTNIITAQNPEIVSDKLKNSIAAGVGVSKLDVAGDISNYMSGKATTDINAAKGNYASLMRQDYKSSPERLESSYVKGLKEAAEPYEKMRSAVKAAKALGTNRVELMRRMKTAGISEAMAYNLLEDKPISVDVLNTDLKKDFQRDLIKTIKDPAKQKEAMERYIYNTQQLVSLKSKYRDKNIEELQ